MNYIIILHVEMIMSKIHLQLDQIKSAPTVLDLSVIEEHRQAETRSHTTD